MAQVGCWMTEDQANELKSYARSLELSRPTMCVLLIHRELRRPRLARLLKTLPAYPNDKSGTRVTARIESAERKRAFSAHAKALRIGSDEAAWLLYCGELEEEWVKRDLAWNPPVPES